MNPALSILADLDEVRNISELAGRNGIPYRTTQQAIRYLIRQGLVTRTDSGRESHIRVASMTLTTLAKPLVHQPHPAWPEVFRGDRPMLLHVLDRIGDIGLTAWVMGKGRSTVYAAFDSLAGKGILVGNRGVRYGLNRLHGPLGRLLAEMARVTAFAEVRKRDPEAEVLWHLGPEVLFSSRKRLGSPFAGVSAFADHGILIIGTRTVYSRTRRVLSPADHILQSLVIDPHDPIMRSYAALVYEVIRPTDLVRTAEIYGLAELAAEVILYVDEGLEPPGFLPWSEHERYRRLYQVEA